MLNSVQPRDQNSQNISQALQQARMHIDARIQWNRDLINRLERSSQQDVQAILLSMYVNPDLTNTRNSNDLTQASLLDIGKYQNFLHCFKLPTESEQATELFIECQYHLRLHPLEMEVILKPEARESAVIKQIMETLQPFVDKAYLRFCYQYRSLLITSTDGIHKQMVVDLAYRDLENHIDDLSAQRAALKNVSAALKSQFIASFRQARSSIASFLKLTNPAIFIDYPVGYNILEATSHILSQVWHIDQMVKLATTLEQQTDNTPRISDQVLKLDQEFNNLTVQYDHVRLQAQQAKLSYIKHNMQRCVRWSAPDPETDERFNLDFRRY